MLQHQPQRDARPQGDERNGQQDVDPQQGHGELLRVLIGFQDPRCPTRL
jgi:hypothetical protein